ncbi:MAG TPA: hypothetical protein VGY48_13245 [Vicinamibacterales bacterium]|jgi:hypothetical protein|nr:hypothetical protein [Vicinamibacterales bacterium]
MSRPVGVGLLLMLIFGALWTLRDLRRPSFAEINGHVYERFERNGRWHAVGPVSGAAVSNDWDTTTAVTALKSFNRAS